MSDRKKQLFRIRDPDIKKLALVKNPASGHRWHLLKSMPEEQPEGPDQGPQDDLDEAINNLSRDEAEELLEEIEDLEYERQLNERFDALEQKIDEAATTIRARKALEIGTNNGHLPSALAKAAPNASADQLRRVAEQLEHQEIADRQRRILADMRNRPRHATSWMYNTPTASPEEVADAVQRLGRADQHARTRPGVG